MDENKALAPNPYVLRATKQLFLCNEHFNHGFRSGDLKNEIFLANEFRATSNLYNEQGNSVKSGCSFRALEEGFKAIAIYLLGINRKADLQRVMNEALMVKKYNSKENDGFIRGYFFDNVGACVKILWDELGQWGQSLILCFMDAFFNAVTCNFSNKQGQLTEWVREKQQMFGDFCVWAYEEPEIAEIVETLRKRCEIFDFDRVKQYDVIPNVQKMIDQADFFDGMGAFSQWTWDRAESDVYKNHALMFFFLDALYILANYIDRSASTRPRLIRRERET